MNTDTGMLGLQIATFLAWTMSVGALTWFICRRYLASTGNASDDFFAGGRALSWYVVAGSLMLTNLSTEQLVGLNSVIFTDGCLGGTAWETFAALAMCVTAMIFLPRYLRSGKPTTTGFLGSRFDLRTRTFVSAVFLAFYAIGLCPIVLYTGALAIRNIFDLQSIPLWVVSSAIGIVGACYALFGGLKGVAISDCLNGIGLVFVGLWVPIAALEKIGGIRALFADPSYLRPLVAVSQVYDEDKNGLRESGVPSVPWHITLTGLMLTNLYYWSTNQLIVQRALAAKSLAEGQKGILFAASMKVVGFTFLCVPGLIAIIMVNKGVKIDGELFTVTKADEVYPELVKAVMPTWSLGFFAAVLLGSILSTFNSALNSASTLFGLEIFKVYIRPDASDIQVVRSATIFGSVLTIASLVLAPQLVHVKSIFGFLQLVRTWASLPIVTIFIVGIGTKMPDAFAAKVGICVGLAVYSCSQLIKGVHFLDIFFFCFCISLASMLVATYVPVLRKCFCQEPKPIPYEESIDDVKVDMSPWFSLYRVVCGIVLVIAFLTVALQMGSAPMCALSGVLWVAGTATLMALPARGAQEAVKVVGIDGTQKSKEGEGAVATSLAASPSSRGRNRNEFVTVCV